MTVPFSALVPLVLAAGVLALWKPRAAIVLPLAFHAGYLLRSRIGIGNLELPTTLLELLILAAIAVAGVHACTLGSVRENLRRALRSVPRVAILLAIFFLVAATVSAVVAPHPRTSWGHWKSFVLEPILYAAALFPLTTSHGGRGAIGRALLLGGAVSSSFSLAAAAVEYIRPSSLLPAPYSLASDFSRLRGIYDVPNSLALVLAPLTVFASVLALDRAPSVLRRLARGSLALFVPALLLTQSLGGLGAAALALLVLAVLGMRSKVVQYTISPSPSGRSTRLRGATAVLVGVVLVLLLGLGMQWASGKLTHALAPNAPLRARLQIWDVSLRLIGDHPFLGTGLGTFEPAYQQKLRELLAAGVWGPVLEWVVRDPHNVLLSFWLNAGLLGLLSMGGLVFLALRGLWRGSFGHPGRPQGDSEPRLAVASRAALIALLVFGLMDVPYFKNDLSLLWWALLLLTLADFRTTHSGAPRTAG